MTMSTASRPVVSNGTFRCVVRILLAVLLGVAFRSALLAATSLTAEQALKSLQDGNARYAAAKPIHPDQSAERRTDLAASQNPFAAVLSCADSRVPTEVVFDQGLGDLFTVRVAGNTAGVVELGSLEYGVEHLGTPLLLVLGHSKCGAVSAVVQGAKVHGNIPEAIAPIGLAVEKARAAHPGAGQDQIVAESVRLNVWQTIDTLFAQSPIVRERVKAGKLKVVGAVYDLETGTVNWLGEPVNLTDLLNYTGGQSESQEPVSQAAPATNATEPQEANVATAATPAPAVEYKSNVALWIVGAAVVLALVLGGTWHFSNRGMNHWTVGRRVGAGFATVLVVLSAVAFFGYSGLREAFTAFTQYRTDARHSNLASRIQANFLEARIAAKDLLIFRTQESVDRYHLRKDKLLGFIKDGQSQITEPTRLASLKTIEEQMARHVALHAQLVPAVMAHKDAQANAINLQMSAIGKVIDREAESLKLSFIADQDQLGPRVNHEMTEAQRTILVVCLAAFLLGAGLSWIIARSITHPLQVITAGLSDGSEQVASAAGQVSGSSQSLAEGASEQAASLEETSASLEEVTSMTKRNAENAAQAKDLSAQTRAAADAGAADMEQMKGAMDAIKISSGEIAKIVKTIDEIAFQTNILALNAAVEAARAGEAGMGFAVVAEEVRALAQRSAQAAKETAAKIEDSVSKSENGVHISAKVAQSLQQIVERARKVDALVAEIASASHEQSQGIGQVSTAVSQMDQVTQTNAGSAEESAAAAEELNAQSAELRRIVNELGSLVGIARPVVASSHSASPRPPTPRAPAHRQSSVPAQPRNRLASSASPVTRVAARRQLEVHDDFFRSS